MNTFCLMTLQRYRVSPSLATAFHLNEKEKSLTLRGIFSMMSFVLTKGGLKRKSNIKGAF